MPDFSNQDQEENCFIVFQTANYSLKAETDCLAAGAKRVVSKPVSKDVIEEVLDKWFFMRAENQELKSYKAVRGRSQTI